MPTISMFYGILIKMFFHDTGKHHLPHKIHNLVVAWIVIHHDDLSADWELAVHGKKPFPSRGLDQ